VDIIAASLHCHAFLAADVNDCRLLTAAHFTLGALAGTWRPLDETLSPCDPLEFVDMKPYPDRVRDSQDKTGMNDAIRTGAYRLLAPVVRGAVICVCLQHTL
jgi:acetyl-CoA carboxylase beta subunit